MLAVFGLSISAEAFADSTSLSCTDTLQVSVETGEPSVSSGPTHSSSKKTEEQAPCNDPCHYGSSHFGHSSFTVLGTSVRLHALDQMIQPASFNQNLVEGPCLEGPRRPPRLS